MGQRPGNQRSWARAEGVSLAVMTLVGWSSIPLFLKHFAHLIDVWTSNGWRYAFSAFLWAPVLVWGHRRRALPPGLWRAALIPSIFNAAGQVCFGWAHYKIDPGLLTFGLRVQIVFVAVGAAILFPAERRIIRSPGFLVGLVMVFGGTMATVMLDGGFGRGATAFGVALALASGLFFACYALSVRHYMHGMNSLQAFAAISQYTAVVIVGLMFLLASPAQWRGITLPGLSPLNLQGSEIVFLLLSAVIGIALGHVFYYMSIARLGLAATAGVVQLQPVIVGAAQVWIFPSVTPLSGWQWATGTIAICGAATILVTQHLLSRLAPDSRAEFDTLPVDAMVASASGEDERATSVRPPSP